MGLETSTYVNGLNIANPAATDGLAQADDHLRLIKSTLKNTFPSITGAITATQGELNALDGFTGTVTDLNYAKDLRATGVTAAEFDHLDGVTSNIQTQLNAKASASSPTLTNATLTTPTVSGATLTGTTTVTTVSMSPFTISIGADNRLDIKYGSVTVMSLDTSGNLRVTGNVSAYDTTT